MIALDIATVIIIVGAITAVVTAVSANKAKTQATKVLARPAQNTAHAVRLLDKVVSADEVLPSLPSTLINEIKQFLSQYYKT